MNAELKHKLLYINWRQEAIKINLKRDEFKAKLEEFKANKSLAKSNTKRIDFTYQDTYTYSKRGYWEFIYCREENKYKIYIAHELDDNINEACILGEYQSPGKQARKVISKLFEEYNNCTEKKAFGYCDRETINKCIPKSLYYLNEDYKDKNLKHISKADFSSNYPSNLLGDLPDWHTAKSIRGTVKPNEEYQFAFYIKSGHIAEYNRFDSHNWIQSDLASYLFNSKKLEIIPEKEDITILCKKSDYNFDKVINELYEAKQQNKEVHGISAKLVLNSAIGMMHRKDFTNQSYRLDHLAAIVIARANQAMLEIYERLNKFGIPVLQIIVDGIIYKSRKPIGIKEKSIGKLIQEVTDANFRMRGTNAYIFLDNNNELIQERHGSYNANILTNKLEDINLWEKK